MPNANVVPCFCVNFGRAAFNTWLTFHYFRLDAKCVLVVFNRKISNCVGDWVYSTIVQYSYIGRYYTISLTVEHVPLSVRVSSHVHFQVRSVLPWHEPHWYFPCTARFHVLTPLANRVHANLIIYTHTLKHRTPHLAISYTPNEHILVRTCRPDFVCCLFRVARNSHLTVWMLTQVICTHLACLAKTRSYATSPLCGVAN